MPKLLPNISQSRQSKKEGRPTIYTWWDLSLKNRTSKRLLKYVWLASKLSYFSEKWPHRFTFKLAHFSLLARSSSITLPPCVGTCTTKRTFALKTWSKLPCYSTDDEQTPLITNIRCSYWNVAHIFYCWYVPPGVLELSLCQMSKCLEKWQHVLK